MNYKAFMEQANRLEAQAAALRKQAEEAKAKDAERNTAKIKKARKDVVAATLNYLESVDIVLEEKDIETFEEFLNVLFDELEKSIEQTRQRADLFDRIMKDMKNTYPNPKMKKFDNISDDEKLFNFLRKISE